MEPLYFGTDKDLFGLFHPSATGSSDQAVLVCPPLFIEYYRSYQVLKEVSGELARRGCNVLRFDYRGTGDSGRLLKDVQPADWLQDIREAVVELEQLLGAPRITVLSVRVGALLAARSMTTNSLSVARHVCLDPVADGAAYVADLEQKHRHYHDSYVRAFSREPDYVAHEVLGFEFHPQALTGLTALGNDVAQAQDALQVISTGEMALPGYPSVNVDASCDWEVIRAGKMLFGRTLIDALVAATLGE